MIKKCKKCGRKLRKNNTTGYCVNCIKLEIHICIEPDCNHKVWKEGNRCRNCRAKGKNNGNYKHGNNCKGKVYYCIEPNCNEEVSEPNRRCIKHGNKISGLKRRKPKITYYCIEPICNEEVTGPDRRCVKCGNKIGGLKRTKPKITYYCIEKDCNEKVSEPDRRCCHHAQLLRYSDPKEREKMSNSLRGAKNPNYKGLNPLRSYISNLPEYRQWRKSVFQRDDYTCQDCTKRGGIELHPHHKKYFSVILSEFLQVYSQFSPIEEKEILARLAITYKPFWDVSNGITLCKKCHVLNHSNLEFRGVKT